MLKKIFKFMGKLIMSPVIIIGFGLAVIVMIPLALFSEFIEFCKGLWLEY